MTRPLKDSMTRTHEETTFWLLTQLHLARRIRDEARAASNRDLEARRAMQHELQLAEGRVMMMQLRAEEAERRLAEHRRSTFADVPERLAAREALPYPPSTHVPTPRAPTPVLNPAPGRAAAYLLGWILWHPDGSAAELVSLGIYSDDEISLTYNHAKGFYVRLMSATGDDYADAAAKITTYLAAGPLSRLLPKLKGYTPPAPPSTLETR